MCVRVSDDERAAVAPSKTDEQHHPTHLKSSCGSVPGTSSAGGRSSAISKGCADGVADC